MLRIKLSDGTEIIYDESNTKFNSSVTRTANTIQTSTPNPLTNIMYNVVKIGNWGNTDKKFKEITFYKDDKPVFLYRTMATLKTSWIKSFVNPEVVDDVAVFKDVVVTIEPEEPYLTNEGLIADKVYINPRT